MAASKSESFGAQALVSLDCWSAADTENIPSMFSCAVHVIHNIECRVCVHVDVVPICEFTRDSLCSVPPRMYVPVRCVVLRFRCVPVVRAAVCRLLAVVAAFLMQPMEWLPVERERTVCSVSAFGAGLPVEIPLYGFPGRGPSLCPDVLLCGAVPRLPGSAVSLRVIPVSCRSASLRRRDGLCP